MGSMGGGNDRHLGFQAREEDGMLCPSSGMNGSVFYGSAWDPVLSLNRHETLGGTSMVSQVPFSHSHYSEAMQNHHAISGPSHFVHYMSEHSYPQMPKLTSFGSGSLAELISPFGQGNCDNGLNANGSDENMVQSGDEHQLSEETTPGLGPQIKRRKRGSDSEEYFHPTMSNVAVRKDPSNMESDLPGEHNDRKSKTEIPPSSNARGKQVKQAKDNHQGAEPPKDGYIHVRARRGQATNSHSLAERVRREKISERMKTLQELVPGCNKITGKAVMLDEIINYVQSLQQQVEFLSMKLATVNPEMNMDVEKVLSKDIIYSRETNATTLGFGATNVAGLYRPTTMPLIPQTNFLFPPMNQPVLETELQKLTSNRI